MSGEQLGKYRLVRLLATGGMGEVFLAEQEGPQSFKKRVVVKRLLRHLASDPTFVEMFLDEARLAARVEHPNVVHILELGEEAGAYFIAMEWVKGRSLRELLRATRGTPVPAAVAVTIAVGVLRGLHAAHTLVDDEGRPSGFVHRDVSPENVLVSFEGAVKLVDFGIAKALSASTARGTMLRGKYGYMAPEQYQRGKIDGRTDVFAAGVVLHELLTGARPFAGDNEAAIMHAVLGDEAPRLDEAIGCSPRLADAVQRALCKDPAERFATAEAMALALEAAAAAEGLVLGAPAVRDFVRSAFPDDLSTGPASAAGAPVPRGTAPLASASAALATEIDPHPPVATEPTPARRGRARAVPVLVAAVVLAAGGFGLFRASSRTATRDALASEAPATSANVVATAPVVSAAPVIEPTPSSVPPPTVPPRAHAVDAKERKRAAASVEKAPGTGTLSVRVRPWAEVFVDGRAIGVSPIAPLELGTGRHRVLLRNKDLGKERTVTADVSRGETTTLRVDLFE